MLSKLLYLSRTTPNIGPLLQPLEDITRTKLLPALSGKPAPSDTERELLALPARLGGIGLTNPTTTSDLAYSTSKQVSAPLYNLILNHRIEYTQEAHSEQYLAKREAKKNKRHLNSTTADIYPKDKPTTRPAKSHDPIPGKLRVPQTG